MFPYQDMRGRHFRVWKQPKRKKDGSPSSVLQLRGQQLERVTDLQVPAFDVRVIMEAVFHPTLANRTAAEAVARTLPPAIELSKLAVGHTGHRSGPEPEPPRTPEELADIRAKLAEAKRRIAGIDADPDAKVAAREAGDRELKAGAERLKPQFTVVNGEGGAA